MYCNCSLFDKKLLNICDNEYEFFLKKKNVVGIGIGYKIKSGFYTCQKGIVVFVTHKVSVNELNYNDIIPNVYNGIVTDVIQTGRFKSYSLTQKIRPVIGGYSLGAETMPDISGTVGCLLTDGKYKYILTANHNVIKDEFAVGTKVLQPSISDGGKMPQDVVGTVSKFVPLKKTTFLHEPKNLVDCAAIIVLEESLISPLIYSINTPPLGVANAELKTNVQKVGRTTNKTLGQVIYLNAVMEIEFDAKNKYVFKKQIITSDVAGEGDSGAVVLNMANYAVGLVIGGTDSYTICNTMPNVLKELNLKLVTA